MPTEPASPPEVARLVPEENLTIYSAVDMKRRLLAAVHGPRTVELDLSRVAEMDTAGFQILVLAKRESQRLGRELHIVAHSPAVREVLESYNMLGYFGDPLVIPAEESC
ncbi:MAG TPA: STAS domain-containing protein [Rhodocyclaceae bacterium]|nr:STAS domain-containing protein [Rhodocyclaceae bacterium]